MDVPITCPCPPKGEDVRHPDGDTVTLRDRLNFREATTIRKAVALVDNDDERGRAAEILATLSEFYVLMGVESWTLTDDRGKPLEVSQRAIRDVLLESADVDLVVDAADTLYNQAILLPLLARASNSSPPTPTPSQDDESSTSATTESPSKPPKPSKRSSTTTTRTVGTETTSLSLVGVSNSSQSSRSAA